MKRILATLILLSLTTFGITVQESIIENTLKFEGTKPLGQSVRGIELSTLTRYNKLKGTKWKLSTLTHNQAVTILKEFYWFDRYDYITNEKVLRFIFDFGMNTNSSKAFRIMHKALGLKPQSIMSLELVDKINSTNPKVVLGKLYLARLNYLRSLSSFGRFGRGWKKRLDKLVE